MDFLKLQETIERDDDYPARQFRIDVLSRVLNGTLYDHLKHCFAEEQNDAGEYIPLLERRPSIRAGTALLSLVVDDSVSLLFSEGHWPELECEDADKRTQLAAIMKDCRLNERMIEGATIGSVGSVVFWLRILNGRVFIEALSTEYLTPEFDPEEPDKLVRVTEQYKVRGDVLAAMGYNIPEADRQKQHWWRREWDEMAETHYLPWPVGGERGDDLKVKADEERTVEHSLGFVPMYWCTNLPSSHPVDGPCTFEKAIDTAIEIDYQLSQGGRGLRYSSDPTLLLKEPASGESGMVKGASNAIVVGQDGDAKMLEINGTAADALLGYVRALREFALESIHGNRANADKLSAAQSGRAMELMNQALIWLADRLRVTYGEGALLGILNMIERASLKYPLQVNGEEIGEISDASVTLRWPDWYAPTAHDRQTESNTLKTLTDAHLMSRETAVKSVAKEYDIEDATAELEAIKQDMAAQPGPAKIQENINIDE